jgi:hypothetical protein
MLINNLTTVLDHNSVLMDDTIATSAFIDEIQQDKGKKRHSLPKPLEKEAADTRRGS